MRLGSAVPNTWSPLRPRNRDPHQYQVLSRDPSQQVLSQFCPKLIVPPSVEFVFAVRDVLTRHRQMLDFDVVDLGGNAVCRVVVSEQHAEEANCGLQVQYINREAFAFVRTNMLYDSRVALALPEICFADGRVYCRVVRAQGGGPFLGKYALERSSDGESLIFFDGNFLTREINGVSPSGAIMSSSTRSLDVAKASQRHYTVRVAPGNDIGLLLCGMLAVSKVEGSS